MIKGIQLIYDFISELLELLYDKTIDNMPILFIFLGGIAISMIFNIFWKGEKG